MSNSPSPRRPADEVVKSIHGAVSDAKTRRHEAVTLEHLLVSILKQSDVREALTSMNIPIDSIETSMEVFLDGSFINRIEEGNPHPTQAFDEVVTRAIGTAMWSPRQTPMPLDILLHMLQQSPDDSFAVTSLMQAGLSSLMLKKYLSHGASDESPMVIGGGFDGMAPMKDVSNQEEALKFIARYCLDLNEEARKGSIDPLIGREEEVDTIVQITARRTKNNTILVGDPGVGKTAVAEGLATKIIQNEVPECLSDAVIYSLDIGALMAGTRFRGDLEERLKQILKSFEFIPNGILFIDEIHTIMGTGSGQNSGLDIANILKPALSKGTLKVIGSTTQEEFRKFFDKDRALMRRFKKLEVREPSVEDAKKILRGLKSRYEEYHSVTFTDEAIDAAVDLTSRYITSALLPDKAIDIIDNAGARQRVTSPENRVSVIGIREIETEVSRVAKIPEQNVREDEISRMQHLESDLQSAVFGQDAAITALTDAVFVSRSGLRDTNKPAGAFLFAGPTGSGKTEAARQLAKTLGVPLIKFDMSEYMEKHSVSKLIGSPPGYVGYSDGSSGSGKLINEIETNPHCVLLLDEIEKAHEDVYNILLQVMDDAKLTSSSDKTADFRNVVLIMTTNSGAAEQAKSTIGFGKNVGGDPMVSIKKKFSPEFLNRLDATIQFNRLGRDVVNKIVVKFIDTLKAQATERKVNLTVTDEAVDWLAKNGFDEALGARPLSRAIHLHVKTPLSRLMVIGNLRAGGNALVSVLNDKLSVDHVPD